MTFTAENILLLGSILLFVSILAGKTSYKVGVPTLLLFLIVGIIAGSEGLGGIHFDDPQIAQFVGVVALNFILFSGGLDTKWESVKPIMTRGIVLSTLGVLLTAASLGLFVYWITDFTLLEGLLLGAIVSSTDAAAVFSILRSKSVGLKSYLRPTLELESGSNDPMAYFLTISITSLIMNGETSPWSLIPMFFQQMVIGGLAGYLLGKAMHQVINKISLDFEGLYPVMIIAFVFFTFSATTALGGNGFLAVYLSALILGNSSFIHKKSLMKFFDGQAWLMQIVMFLTLGLLVFPSQILPVMGLGIVISLFLIFVARPLGVFISLAFFKMKTRNKLFVSWVGLRGAVPIVFATYPLLAGVEQAVMIFNLVFFIAVTSVMLQGTTIPLVAKWLHLAVPEKIRRKTPLDLELSDDVKSELLEVEIPENSPVIDKSIVQLNFPKTALIVLINRNSKYITPRGDTKLEKNDKLMVMADNESAIEDVYKSLGIIV